MHRINTLVSTGLTLLLGVMLSGCVVQQTTKTSKIAEFPQMYEEDPASILILPPINESTDAEAKDYYSTTIPIPLILHGYYVFPYELTAEILKQEGIYDSELLRDIPLNKFYDYFGADALLFTTIKKWDLSYLVLTSSLTVSIDCVIKSTQTSNILWSYNGQVVVDLGGGSGGNSMAGFIIQAVVTAAQTASADYVRHARTATHRAMGALPYGRYHALYKQDMEQVIVDQTPEKKATL